MTDYLPAILSHIAEFREPATTGTLWNEIVVSRKFGGSERKDLPATFTEFEAGVTALAVAGKIEAEKFGKADLWKMAAKKRESERKLFA